MSYHIYHTDGFVLNGFDVGENDRLVRIYTRTLGLVPVKIQGARKLSSKHRYHIQQLSYGNYAFVRGKSGWRLVGSQQHPLLLFSHESEKFRTFAKVGGLLDRLCPEEGIEGDEHFFVDLLNGARFLSREPLSLGERKSLETLFALKILSRHGYGAGEDQALAQEAFSYASLERVAGARRKLNGHIHRALEYTQL